MEEKAKRRISRSDINTLKWVYSICRDERFKVYVLILTNSIHGVLTIVFAGFSKKIIDAATVDKSFQRVLFYALMFLCVLLFQLCLSLISRSTSERCKAKIEWRLKQYMLKSIMKKDYASVSKYHTGELQNRMFNDVTVISEGFTTILPSVLFFLVRLTSAFAYLVVIDRIFALAFLVGGLSVFLFTQVFRKTLKRLHKDVQQTEGKTRSFIQEAITSLLVVKSFSVEKKIAATANELQAENYKAKMKRRFFGIVANAGISLVFNTGYVFALSYGAYMLVHEVITYGTVTAMLQLVNQIQSPFAALSGIMPQYFSLVASAERLIEIDKLPNESSENVAVKNPQKVYDMLKSINFNDIVFSYDRDVILDNTSLKINKGDFVAIMGISGIGKSTLLKLLLGVFNVNSGNIELELDKGKIEVDNKTRRLFSYVPQGNFLLSGTIRENLTFINDDATDEEIEEAIRISCSDAFINELPDGLETVIGERGVGLSEGQLQRLAIARSLLSKAPVVLLDEATSALDEETEKRFLTNLKQLDNKTCIIVSHKKAALEICNKHVQIIDSKIVVEEN